MDTVFLDFVLGFPAVGFGSRGLFPINHYWSTIDVGYLDTYFLEFQLGD